MTTTTASNRTGISLSEVVLDDGVSTIPEMSDLSELADAFEPVATANAVEEPLTIQRPVMLGSGSITDLITDVDDNVENLTWLIYGKNGTGKTTLLSTVDGMLILAIDQGTLSIRDKAKGTAKKITIAQWDNIEQVYWALKDGKWNGNSVTIPVKGGTFTVKSIGFDTVTKLAQVCLRNVVLGAKETDTDVDVVKPTQAHWGQMTQRMQFWLAKFKELPLQKVWLCQEASNSENLDDEEFSIYPDVNRALRTYILSEADIIGRTYIKRIDPKTVQFRLLLAPNDRCVTKDRTTKLGGVIQNPRLDVLYNRAFQNTVNND